MDGSPKSRGNNPEHTITQNCLSPNLKKFDFLHKLLMSIIFSNPFGEIIYTMKKMVVQSSLMTKPLTTTHVNKAAHVILKTFQQPCRRSPL